MSTITIITGHAGCGKSTVSKLVAASMPKCFVISADDIREMMISGRPELVSEEEFQPEEIEEFEVARKAVTKIAEVYFEQGIPVIVDDVCVPPMFAEHYKTLTEVYNAPIILLKPDLQTAISRIRGRAGKLDTLLEEYLPIGYKELETMPTENWATLDTSNWTPEYTVKQVLTLIEAQN
jgi:predicted kinase